MKVEHQGHGFKVKDTVPSVTNHIRSRVVWVQVWVVVVSRAHMAWPGSVPMYGTQQQCARRYVMQTANEPASYHRYNQGWICQGVGGSFDLSRTDGRPSHKKSEKHKQGVVNEPHQGTSHLTIHQPTISIGWLCSCVVQSCVLWLLTT